MPTKPIFKKAAIGLVVLLVLVQFIRPTKNSGAADSPNDIAHVVQVPDNVKLILQTACYDCHSNHTTYPWYTEIMPLGWWLNHHVEEGKEHLNFSEFALYEKKRQDHKLEETEEEVEEKEMPLESYTLIHQNAKLTPEQIQLVVDWVKAARKEISATN